MMKSKKIYVNQICTQFVHLPLLVNFNLKITPHTHNRRVSSAVLSVVIISAQMSPFLFLNHPGFSNGWLGMAVEYKRVSPNGAWCGQTEVRQRSLIWEVDYGVIATFSEWSHSSTVCQSNYWHTPSVCVFTYQFSVWYNKSPSPCYPVIISAKDEAVYLGSAH